MNRLLRENTVRGLMAGGIALVAALGAQAKVTLPKFYTDNMVVQRDATLTIPGTANPGATVTATADWSDKAKATAKADAQGRFSLQLPTPGAGGPYTIIVSDGSDAPAVLQNVLSGEVWLCSGQSNMEFPIKGWGQVMDADEVVATSFHPEIRLLQIKKNTSFAPLDDAEVNMGGWTEANPTAMDFSAIAYLFAKQISDSLQVPVGVIDSSWGGTPAEAWTPFPYLKDIKGFEPEVAALERSGFTKEGLQADYERRCAEWEKELLKSDIVFDKGRLQSGDRWATMPVPGEWENTVLPAFDGVVWTQTTVDVPAADADKDLTLHFGPVDNEDVTYFNGTKVGSVNSWTDQRNYTVPGKLVKAGANVLTVRITDFDGAGGFCGTPDMYYAETASGKRIPLTGDWSYTVAANLRDIAPHPVAAQGPSYPTVLYNAMINPLNSMPLRGVLWYQGCANVGRAEQYGPLFRNMITAWREHWGQKELPFYFVQLAGWLKPRLVQPDSEWAALRQAQADALVLPETGMAVAIDLGNPGDIHPVNKQEVARRLGLIALNRTYDKPCVDAAPVCESVKREGDKLVLKFSAPLAPKAGVLTGFIIGDKAGKYASATARLTAPDTVVLSSPLVAAPVAVKYAWADHPFGSLYGAAGDLPVAPFRKAL